MQNVSLGLDKSKGKLFMYIFFRTDGKKIWCGVEAHTNKHHYNQMYASNLLSVWHDILTKIMHVWKSLLINITFQYQTAIKVT